MKSIKLVTFDSVVHSRLTKKEMFEYQCLIKMDFYEMFDFQRIYLTKVMCRRSFVNLGIGTSSLELELELELLLQMPLVP